MPEIEGWLEYRKLILSELERVSRELRDLNEKVLEIHTEIAMLKVKSGLWGALAGAIPAIVLWALSRK
jgi:hypothetical protein